MTNWLPNVSVALWIEKEPLSPYRGQNKIVMTLSREGKNFARVRMTREIALKVSGDLQSLAEKL